MRAPDTEKISTFDKMIFEKILKNIKLGVQKLVANLVVKNIYGVEKIWASSRSGKTEKRKSTC